MSGRLLCIFSILCVSICLVSAQFSALQFSSDIYRVSPYGTCGSAASLRASQFPCLSGQYEFEPLTAKNVTPPTIASLASATVGTNNLVYLGAASNTIMTILPTVIPNASIMQQFAPTLAKGNYIYSISDGSTYVAFLSQLGVVVKYTILSTGLLDVNGSTSVDTTLGAITTLAAVSTLPTVYFASGSKVVSVNLALMTAGTVVDVNAVLTTTVTNIVCGAYGANGVILFSAENGVVFPYSTSSNAPLNPPLVTSETFSLACAAKDSTYGIFVANSYRLYQVSFPASGSAPTIQVVIENVGQSPQVPGRGSVNSDQTAFYFPTYTVGGGGHSDNIYEFALFPNQVDFYSVTQADVTDKFFANPVVFSSQLNNVIYIGTNGPLSNIYTLSVRTISFVNGTRYRLYPNANLPTNPTGANGKTNSIGDLTQTATNGDFIIGAGLTTLGNQNASSAIPPSGPITTYFRGTQTDAPAHGGLANSDSGLSLKLVSLDEVTLPGPGVTLPNGSTTVLVRSIPFYSSDLAPWFLRQTIQPSGSTGPTTGYVWSVGKTDTVTDAANQYNYMVPPYVQVQNNSLPPPVQQSGARKRDPVNTNQNTLGYVLMQVQHDMFPVNSTSTTVNGVSYNVSSRTGRYIFTIYNWPYLSSSNFLRLNMLVGIGPDGNTSIANYPLGLNQTLAPIFPGHVLVTEDADWTLVFPQATITGGSAVNSPLTNAFDPNTQSVSVYFPHAAANTTQTYTFFLEYTYIPPPPVLSSHQDGGGPKLLPLWIVLGVVGGLIIIAVIIVIIVIVVVYKVAGDKIKAWIQDSQFDQTENALREDRGPF